MEIVELGLYVLEDEYLKNYYIKDYPQNKEFNERPFFACFQDNKNTDIYWIIPISSQTQKYVPILEKHPNAGIVMKLYNNKESVLLTQNIVPIHKKFIKREYTVNNIPFKILRNEDKKEILKKARKIRSLLMNRKLFFSNNIILLYDQMLEISLSTSSQK